MTNCDTTTEDDVRCAEWTTVADASGPILRRAATGALLQDSRLELCFDVTSGEYHLGVAVSS